MYDGIKTALGPIQRKTAPLKSTTGDVITDQAQQMHRWLEHYSELYSSENLVKPSALSNVERLPVMEELDAVPTEDELSKAIDSLVSGKAPGNDSIPPDLLKQCKTTLLHPLHELLCQCWEEGAVPQVSTTALVPRSLHPQGNKGSLTPKTALGPIQSKTAPLKSTTGEVITDQAQ